MGKTQETPKMRRGRLQTTQDRAARTQRAILESARRCINQHGYDNTPVKEIAAEAGVSVGSIYEHFRDKRTLLREVARIEIERLESEFFAPFHRAVARKQQEAGGELLPSEIVELAITSTIAGHRRVPRILAEIVDTAGRDPELQALVDQSSEKVVDFLQQMLVFFQVRTPGREAEITARILFPLCGLTIRHFALNEEPIHEAELARELTLLINRYLFP